MSFAWRLVLAVLAAAALAAPAHAQDAGTAPPEPVIADGVTIAGVPVGGMTAAQATAAVDWAFRQPVKFRFKHRTWNVTVRRLGATAYVDGAVRRAFYAVPGEEVEMVVTIRGTDVRSYVAYLDRRYSRAARESRLVGLRNLRPFITRPRNGWAVKRLTMTTAIINALKNHTRGPLTVRTAVVRPRITRASFGSIIVIRRESRRLYLYDGMRFWRRFAIAVGTPSYPTPLGRFSIATKQRNPTWNPPDSDWARGLGPVPPGPGNPLGTRWMGLSAFGYGIHGTPSAYTIGTAASHGCIRMYISEAEWLFDRVRVGTPVYIIRA